jgi:ribonuclease HI
VLRAECAAQVTGYPNAVFKKFSTLDQAQDFAIPGTVHALSATKKSANLLSFSSVNLSLGPSCNVEPVHPPRVIENVLSAEKALVVYTDGACKNNQGGAEKAAGIGVWWGMNDPRCVRQPHSNFSAS